MTLSTYLVVFASFALFVAVVDIVVSNVYILITSAVVVVTENAVDCDVVLAIVYVTLNIYIYDVVGLTTVTVDETISASIVTSVVGGVVADNFLNRNVLGAAISGTVVLVVLCWEVYHNEVLWCEYYVGNNVLNGNTLYISAL